MNPIMLFLTQIFLTVVTCILVTAYLKGYLERVLTVLCGAKEQADYWLAFANVLMIGFPLIFSLGYRPQAATAENSFFEIMGRLGVNLGGFLAILTAIGITLAFFILVSPRAPKLEPK